ncbi:MAG: tripartite tricarboxylate transporter substrate binding protein, partial [Oxalobacteraceae bacterium]
HRSPALKDVPTFAELGLPAMNAVTWFAVMAPPGTQDAVVQKTWTAIASALKLPDVMSQFAVQGAEPKGTSPEDTGHFIKAETDKWREVIKTNKVVIE